MPIDNYFCERNDEKASEVFYKKFNYSFTAQAASMGMGNLKDFSYAEKLLYGRVNRNYVPMIMSRNAVMGMISVAPDQPVAAHTFVVEAFKALQANFRKSMTMGKLHPAGALSNLTPVKGYQDPKVLYAKHMNSLLIGIRSAYRKDNIRIKDFDEFVQTFIPTLEKIVKSRPYTMPAYVKHRLCPINVSGLVIEIATGDFTSDKEKVDSFFKDPNWGYYLNACRAYGFSVDKNAPWRLVADIGTSEMVEYSSREAYYSTDMIIGAAYELAHISYYERFIAMLLAAYRFLKTENYIEAQYIMKAPHEAEYCQDGSVRPKLIKAESYTEDSLMMRYGEMYFLKLYLRIRMAEEIPDSSDNEKHKLETDAINAYLHDDKDKALRAFEMVIAKMYAKSGSLTNRLESAKLRKEDAYREDELQGAVSTYR